MDSQSSAAVILCIYFLCAVGLRRRISLPLLALGVLCTTIVVWTVVPASLLTSVAALLVVLQFLQLLIVLPCVVAALLFVPLLAVACITMITDL